MAGEVEAFTQRLMAEIASQLGAAGADIIGYTRGILNVPVEYEGGRVIRSVSPEPPRKDTGDLQANIDAGVALEGTAKVQLTVSSGREQNPEVPMLLEFGIGIRGDRPYMWGAGAELPRGGTSADFARLRLIELVEELKAFTG